MPSGGAKTKKIVTISIDADVHERITNMFRSIPNSPTFSGFVEAAARELVDTLGDILIKSNLATPTGALTALTQLNVLGAQMNKQYLNELEEVAKQVADQMLNINTQTPKESPPKKKVKKVK